MRRLPIYFLIDVSESMVGEPITQIENGMRNIIQELRTDPYALETVFVSVIVFAGKAKKLLSLTELYKFYPPKFPIGDGTSLGVALNFLMDDMERSLQKTTEEMKGDWKPIVFLFTDGTPTDNPDLAIERWKKYFQRNSNLVCISLGNNVDTNVLGKLTDNVLRLNGVDEYSFKTFFKWVTASIKTCSVSVSDSGIDNLQLAPFSGVNLEKVDTKKSCKVDENYVVLHGKCSNTKKRYLVKYVKQISTSDFLPEFNVMDYKLVGAYSIDEESFESLSEGKSSRNINTNNLRGMPTCPCCGNQFGVVICECGNIMCSDGYTALCPWCGMEGTLGGIEDGGIDITRGRG